ncbi:hypothetical protein K439DRAFT_1614775 [Ramaria rubella]|nr:hypothetical protein K439DRAFT_1614775 [Ramaria rubella]
MLRAFLILTWFILTPTLAQLAGTPPQCALSCVVPGNYPGCVGADTECLCTGGGLNVTQPVQTCIQQACTNSTDRAAAVTFVEQECVDGSGSVSSAGIARTTTVSAASEATGAQFGENAASYSHSLSLWSILAGLVAILAAP